MLLCPDWGQSDSTTRSDGLWYGKNLNLSKHSDVNETNKIAECYEFVLLKRIQYYLQNIFIKDVIKLIKNKNNNINLHLLEWILFIHTNTIVANIVTPEKHLVFTEKKMSACALHLVHDELSSRLNKRYVQSKEDLVEIYWFLIKIKPLIHFRGSVLIEN